MHDNETVTHSDPFIRTCAGGAPDLSPRLAEAAVIGTASRPPRVTLPGARALDERGMTTAEYAVGTVAAVGFAGVLIKILTSEEVREVILQLILALIQFFLGQLPTFFG